MGILASGGRTQFTAFYSRGDGKSLELFINNDPLLTELRQVVAGRGANEARSRKKRYNLLNIENYRLGVINKGMETCSFYESQWSSVGWTSPGFIKASPTV